MPGIITEADVSQFEALLRAAMGGPSATGGQPQKDRLADAYTALGITADAKPAEIKRPVAEERSRELNSAYDMIKKARSDIR